MSLRSRTTWISALLALFMVLVLPACWYGALEQARALGQVAPSGSNNNEERAEHEEHEVAEHQAIRRAPPPLDARVGHVVGKPETEHVPNIIASVAWVTHPSLFSERLLI